jgi:hypothetical protein
VFVISAQRPVNLGGDFSWFSSDHPGKCSGNTSNYYTIASFHILSNSFFINYRIIRRCIDCVVDGVVK